MIWITPEKNSELFGPFGQDRSMDQTQHGNITASGQRSKMKINQRSNVVYAYIAQKTTLDSIQSAEFRTRCVVNRRCPVLEVAEQVGFIKYNQISVCVETPSSKKSSKLPAC